MDELKKDSSNLVDIRSVKVNKDLLPKERVEDYIKQINNPYLYKCGKVTVQIGFADTAETLEDRLQSYLLSLL